MGRLRILLIALFAVAALATAASAAHRQGPVEDGTLSIRDGRANMVLRLKGGVIGRFASGRLTVIGESDAATVVVNGAEREYMPNENTTVYSGKNIRFRIMDDRRFVMKLHAAKIGVSVVGRGNGWLDGWGNPAKGIFFDGSYSVNGGPYRSIPDTREPIQLSASPTGG